MLTLLMKTGWRYAVRKSNPVDLILYLCISTLVYCIYIPKIFMLQVDILVNNAGLALGTAGVHQNDIKVLTCMDQS